MHCIRVIAYEVRNKRSGGAYNQHKQINNNRDFIKVFFVSNDRVLKFSFKAVKYLHRKLFFFFKYLGITNETYGGKSLNQLDICRATKMVTY